MAKLKVTGYFIVSIIPEDGDRHISRLALDGERIVFSAELKEGDNVVSVDEEVTDLEAVRHALQPLREVVRAIYPELFAPEE